jgi:hypothetical protein
MVRDWNTTSDTKRNNRAPASPSGTTMLLRARRKSRTRVPTCTGHTDYNWGIAAFHLLATKRFLKFIP